MQNGYNLGLVSVSFRAHTPPEILQEMKKAALTHVEWGSDVHAPCNDVEGLVQIAALQKEYGIACSSYGTYFRLGKTPLSELQAYIAAAKILGTDILRLWCGTRCGAEMTEEEKSALLAGCKEAAAIAERAGVTLCMECHRKTFTERAADAVWLMEEVDSPHFRMYWQPFQWQTVRENCENAGKIAPFAEHIHVFHWIEKEKFPLAQGLALWKEYLSCFDGSQNLLLEFMPDGKPETLPREVETLGRLIG